MRLLAAFVFAALPTTLPSCASLTANGPDLVPISSDPPGATIYVSRGEHAVGVTPATVALKRAWSDKTLRLELAGYHPQKVVPYEGVNGAVFGNILFGGIIGLCVDLVSGNAWAVSETPLHVMLTPLDEPCPEPFVGRRWGDAAEGRAVTLGGGAPTDQ